MSRIYVASSWRNALQPDVVDVLRAEGHEVYDFRHPHLEPGQRGVGFHWSSIDPDWQEWTPTQYREALQHSTARDGFSADKAGMEWADIGVLVTPCGRSSHTEIGWMIGRGKKTAALLVKQEPELMYGLLDSLCVTVAEVVEFCKEEEQGR